MKYYATIYIHPMDWNIPHVFLGLTKDKSPDELDKIDEQLRQEYLKNKEWNKIEQKRYEAKEPNEFNDDFWGFGIKMNSVNVTSNKMLKNNQYIVREYL
ncbi:hypothetical protein UPTC15744_00922 [Campylobacter lari]|uniref:hypothetical protein n=1 Tax=Campylobacter lari TaxID=201 RepID=UPI00215242E8|nr:hypothetical protein [Campylobacter lari]MCR6537432.1 hypothetical protein [Campylobacter lari]